MNAKPKRKGPAQKSALVSLRVSLPRELADLARADAVHFNKALDGIALAIFRPFFAVKREERAKAYANIPAKKMGRRVTL